MVVAKKQTTGSTKTASRIANDKSNGSQTSGSTKSKPTETALKSKLSPEQQAEELVKAIRNLIHKKYGVTIQRRDSRVSTKVGHAVREKLGLDIQAQINKRNGNGNGRKFDWQEWNNTTFPKLFGRPDALKHDVEVVALFMSKLYDTISGTTEGAIADLVEFNVQSLKRRNEIAKEAETDDDLELDDELDADEDEIDDILDEVDDEEEEEEDEDDEDFEVDEDEEFEEDDE
ncbi:MAG: hypothetical protein F6K32_20315 [Desertifilum sp. SIO1I2]|nr:hypothetical protein [Desertifilum sp. SIO1I2]